MHDALFMRGVEAVGKTLGDIEKLRNRHASIRNDPVERLTLHELHREEVNALRFVDRVDCYDMRMIQRRDCAGFPLEALEPLRVRGHLARKDLEGDFATELRVGSAIDLTHAACADRSGDAVVRDLLADQGKRRSNPAVLFGGCLPEPARARMIFGRSAESNRKQKGAEDSGRSVDMISGAPCRDVRSRA